MKVRYAQYKCNDCGATDTDKVFNHERPATVINCYKCHAGLGTPAAEQQAMQKGMVLTGSNERRVPSLG